MDYLSQSVGGRRSRRPRGTRARDENLARQGLVPESLKGPNNLKAKGYAPANSGTRCRGEGGRMAALTEFFLGHKTSTR